MDRVIFHCDLNAFYASVELLEHPELWERPVAVCGDPASRKGIILAKNEPAKRKGVKTAQTIWQAKKACPDLVLLPAHHGKYRQYSKLANEVYERYTDLVEPFGIDESWLDLTGSLHLFGGDARQTADEIRAVMKAELGLSLSIGVSFNKVFAKLGSDYRKPDATTVISRENYRALVWPLPVSDLLFVGATTARLLERHGIRTIGELAACPPEILETLLGKHGVQLYQYATGEEHSQVHPASYRPMPKSVGNGTTFQKDLEGWEEIWTGASMLADRVGERLRRYGLACTAVQVTVRDPHFRDKSRQRRLACPTNLSREILRTAMELIKELWQEWDPVRSITVTALNLLPEGESGEQMDLFDPGRSGQHERQARLEQTVDRLRGKYGRGAIRFGGGAELGAGGKKQGAVEKVEEEA